MEKEHSEFWKILSEKGLNLGYSGLKKDSRANLKLISFPPRRLCRVMVRFFSDAIVSERSY